MKVSLAVAGSSPCSFVSFTVTTGFGVRSKSACAPSAPKTDVVWELSGNCSAVTATLRFFAIASPASAQTRRKIRGMGSFAAALFLVSALKQNGIAVILSAAEDLQPRSSRSRAVSPIQDDERCKSPRSELTQAEMNVCAEG